MCSEGKECSVYLYNVQHRLTILIEQDGGLTYQCAQILICDTIKGNELDVGDVVFEILAKTVFKFLCFILFLALPNSS